MVHQHDLQAEQKRAAQQHPFTAGQAQCIVPGQAEQIQPHYTGGDAAPQLYAGAAAKKYTEHRYQHHIQRRHKPGLGRAGGANANLLRRRGRKQRRTAEHTALYQHLAVLPKARLSGRIGLARLAQHGHQSQQKYTGQPAAARQKRVGTHVVSPHTLCHKGGAPDKGRPHQQQGVVQLYVFHKLPLYVTFPCITKPPGPS